VSANADAAFNTELSVHMLIVSPVPATIVLTVAVAAIVWPGVGNS